MSETKTPWKKLQNKDYLGECDFLPGEEKTVTIATIATNEITGTGGEVSNKPVMRFVEQVKPLIVNTTNFKMMQRLFQSRFIEDWIGKQVILYGDPSIKFGRDVVGGVRVKAELPHNHACADCGQVIMGSGKFTAAQVVQATTSKYGRALCADCAKAAKERLTETEQGGADPNRSMASDQV
jgi:hypothetical protein